MDPQSQSFTPYSNSQEGWKLQSDVTRIQQVQQEHSDRLARLERKQDDDARMKSVWGNSSPFPSVLSGTPQQAPLQQPQLEQYRNFDEDPNSLMTSLHLDAEEEPRRGMGATSRANSVRFDETANQNHFSHSTRPSMDIFSRTSSGMGGLQMSERTTSHKSDGRASSAHSMRSAASGRASSLNLDMGCGLESSTRSPPEPLAMAPGLLLLGNVPAIIRCWMNTNFKHDALLYAAVCTGSYKSFIDLRLIHKLGFEDDIKSTDAGVRTVRLPVYFPEAVLHPASSRSSSPAPHMPNLTVDFCIVDRSSSETDKSIQIFLGSDILQSHSADILFSSNTVTLIDDEQSKLSIPLVRPENEDAFRNLCVTSSTLSSAAEGDQQLKKQPTLNGAGQGSSTASVSSAAASPPPGRYRPPGAIAAEAGTTDSSKASAQGSDHDLRPSSRQSNASRPSLSLLNTRAEANDQTAESTSQATPQRMGSSPAIWSNWRRDANTPTTSAPQTAGLDWASAGKNRENPYQRKDTGMKVLKPKTASRTFSTSATTGAPSPSPADGKSRFFDEGRRKSGSDNKSIFAESKKENQLSAGAGAATPLTSASAAPKTKSNPIGGGSAFSWLTPPASGGGTVGGNGSAFK